MKKIILVLTLLVVFTGIMACERDHTHKFLGELTVIKEPTCGENGQANMCCGECGAILNTTILPKTNNHNEILISGFDATCNSVGLSDGKKCADCGEVIVAQLPLPVKAHTEGVISSVDPTCENTGLSEGVECTICKTIMVEQQILPRIAHTYDNVYDDVCNQCGYVRTLECEHNETEIVMGYEATCTSSGLTNGVNCRNCGEIVIAQEVITIIPHTEVIDESIESTCTRVGLTEGKHCSVCNTVIVAQIVTEIKEHNFGEWVTVKESTELEYGLKERYCQCGKIDTLVIDKIIKGSKGLEYTLNTDGLSYSVIGIGTCEEVNIVIPNMYNGLPVTQISDHAFSGCTSLVNVSIPNTVIYIGSGAFKDCISIKFNQYDNGLYLGNENNPYHALMEVVDSDITSCIVHADTVIIYEWAFATCANLSDVSFEENSKLKIIGERAFNRCYSLKSIDIPNSVVNIENYAFSDCKSLLSVVIPNSVNYIGSYVFMDCRALVNLNFEGTIDEWETIEKGEKWTHKLPANEVICSDGTVKLN